MTDTRKEAAWDALMNYQQADEDGVMVLVSRQAIHECKDERDALRSQLQAARDEALESAALKLERQYPSTDNPDGSPWAHEVIRALKSTSAEGEG